jgi:hypothetical protein
LAVDVCFGVVALGMAILVLAAAGHGIWLALAAVVRHLSGDPSRTSARPRRQECVACREPIPPGAARCEACGLPVRGATATELRDLDATVRQLERFRDAGTLDDTTFERLWDECLRARRRLLGRPPVRRPTRRREHEEAAPQTESITPPVATAADPASAVSVSPSPSLPVPSPPVAAAPGQSVASVLAAFMEEKNILWGEIVGGLLIVGCSVALVISLWEMLERIPYFPFLLFAGITAALFGAGLYTLHRWKLHATSRGLLAVALLLVPLDFLVLAGLSRGEGGAGELAVEAAALAVFGTLVSVAARDLVPSQRWRLTAALLGCAGAELLVPRLLDPSQPGAWLAPLAWLPALCFALPAGAAFLRAVRDPPTTRRTALELLGLIGIAAFAFGASLGLVVYRGGDVGNVLPVLALPLAVTAAPVLALGIVLYRAPGDDRAPDGVSGGLRTAGTAVALAAMTVMLVAAGLAWPRPPLMLAVGLLDFAVLTAVALKYRVPVAHALALPCLAVAYLTGFHLLTGTLDLAAPPPGDALLSLAASPASGTGLIALVVALAAMSEAFVRLERRLDSLCYAVAAGMAALLSVLLTVPHPVGGAGRTAVVCGAYGALALALNVRWRRQALLITAQLLLALAVLFGVTWALAGRAWVGDAPAGLADPRSPQAYGSGLAALTLAWVALRIAARSSAVARRLVEGDEPPLHRVLLAGLVVTTLGLAAWGAFPGVIAELAPGAGLGPHAEACGPGAWGLLAAVTAVVLVALWEWPVGAVASLAVAAVTAAVLAAAGFAAEHATASALRWGLAVVFLAGSAALWLRTRLARLATAAGIALEREPPSVESVRALLVVLAAGPVLVLTLFVALAGFAGQPPGGPDADSFFGRVGWVASNVLPLLAVSAALVGHGIRERRPGYVFAAALIADAALAGGYALHQALAGGLDTAAGLRAVQLGAGGAALWALAWTFALRRRGGRLDDAEARAARPLLGVLATLGAAGNVVLVLLPLLRLLFDPGAPLPAALAVIGDGGGWLALLLGSAALLSQVGPSSARAHVLAASGLCAGVLAACLVNPWDSGDWLSYHVLLAAWGSAGVAVIAAALAGASLGGAAFPRQAVCRWAEGIAAVLALLALRGAWADPLRPYGPAAATLSACGIAVALALSLRLPRHVYATGALVGLVGLIVWLAWGADTVTSFVGIQVIGLALASGLWSAAELVVRRTGAPIDLRSATRSFCDGAGWLGLGLLAAVVAVGLATNLTDGGPPPDLSVMWAALILLSLSYVPALCDADARPPAARLYAAGLLAVGLTLASLDAAPERIAQVAALLLGGYALLAAGVARLAPDRLKRAGDSSAAWFLPAQGAVAGAVVVLSAWIACHFDTAVDRLSGPGAVALLAGAAAVLARQFPSRYAALSLGVVVLAECGWSFLGTATPAPWMHRTVLLVAALAVTTVAYGIGLARWKGAPDWAECGRRTGPVLGVLALALLFVVLGQEFLLYDPDPAVRRTPLAAWAVAVVAAALVGLMAAQVRFAVRPDSDSFGLSERRRTLYVYAAEVLLLGLFVHVRLNLPGLFGQHFGQRWPFLVMGVAFVGVGLAEFFRRRGLPVLAGPLHSTGVFLPLLPLLAFWVRPPQALQETLIAHAPGAEPLLKALDRLPTYFSFPSQFDRYSLLWLLLGALYAGAALARRSSRYALLAALAANVSLWCLLHHYGWAFLVHPQLWLVPLALIVLVAEHLNRERLAPAEAAALRYAGLGVLYLSSTADMFIAGLGHSLALPLVLALLSVLGVLAGIALRVRAFLLLGVGFLGVVVLAMIWHAAVDLAQTWLWWASGIALGAAILGLFALFEKRRNDVLRVLEEVRRWH